MLKGHQYFSVSPQNSALVMVLASKLIEERKYSVYPHYMGLTDTDRIW